MATITEDYVSFETAKLLKEKGYEQAEKDLELTWEDIKTIDKLLNKCVDYSNPYQKVLKLFKDLKNNTKL